MNTTSPREVPASPASTTYLGGHALAPIAGPNAKEWLVFCAISSFEDTRKHGIDAEKDGRGGCRVVPNHKMMAVEVSR